MAPVVLFLDELDALGAALSRLLTKGHGSMLLQLSVCLATQEDLAQAQLLTKALAPAANHHVRNSGFRVELGFGIWFFFGLLPWGTCNLTSVFFCSLCPICSPDCNA